jgi:hypothetical protein
LFQFVAILKELRHVFPAFSPPQLYTFWLKKSGAGVYTKKERFAPTKTAPALSKTAILGTYGKLVFSIYKQLKKRKTAPLRIGYKNYTRFEARARAKLSRFVGIWRHLAEMLYLQKETKMKVSPKEFYNAFVKNGRSLRKTAKALGIDRNTANRYWKKIKPIIDNSFNITLFDAIILAIGANIEKIKEGDDKAINRQYKLILQQMKNDAKVCRHCGKRAR